jgi:hypothetical protein
MPLVIELLIVAAVLIGVPVVLAFARYRLWRARVAAGRAVPGFVGFLHAEFGWRVPFMVIGAVLAIVAFVAVVLAPTR